MIVNSIFEATLRGVLRGGLLVPVLALLSMTVAVHADSPASAVQIFDVDLVQGNAVSVRNDCWEGAPMEAIVLCAPPAPEFSDLSIVIELQSASSTDTVITYRSMDLTATAGTDYVALDGMLTIKAGDLQGTIALDFIDDLVEEGNETFVVAITAPENVVLAQDYVHVTIVDEESIKITVADASASEGDPRGMPLSATLSDSVSWQISIRVGTTAGTAGTSDYRDSDEQIVVPLPPPPPGQSYRGFTIRHKLINDSLDEPDETYTLTIWGHDYVSRDAGSGTMTIRDNDNPPRVSIADAGGFEDAVGKLSFDVVLDAISGKEITLDYATADDTATAGSDYASNSGTLTFDPGDREKTVEVTVTSDDIYEDDDAFTVTLSDPKNVRLGDNTAVGTIQNDDAQLSIAAAAASEGDGELSFRVKADGLVKTNQTVTVTYETADGTATAGSDYTSSSGALTFTSTDTEQMITVNVIDDIVDEPDETFAVNLVSPVNASLGDASAQGTIRDNDATSTEISLRATPVRVSEGDGATDIEVTATLDAGARAETTTVTVSVAGSGDADAVDFTDVQDFTITIADGDTSGSGIFMLHPEDDNVNESDETITVGGSSDLSVTGDTVELVDDDQPSAEILLSASPARISEDEGAKGVEVTATLDASARTVPTTVSVSVADSGQSDAVDYASTSMSFDITIAAGATAGTGTFTVTPENDEIDERDEVLDITGASDLSVTPTSVTLADDDRTSTEILLSAVPSTVSEGAGETSVEVTATLDAGARTVSTTVTVEVTGTGDPEAVGFTAPQHFVIPIAEGAISGRGTFILVPEDDDLEESSETLTLDGTADLSVRSASVTLTDNDVASDRVVLSASPARVSEDGGAVPVRVTASLNGAARQAATAVTVSLSGSGNPNAVDFQTVSDFTIAIAARAASASGTFTLEPVDDGTAEADETLTISGASDLPVDSTTVTLADDDDASTRILLSASPARVSEGDGPTPVTVTATLDRASRQRATSVTVSVSGSGDPDASDFTAVADFAITIPANASSGTGTFTLAPEDDVTVESDERLAISGASDLPVTSTSVTLADDDEVPTRILLFLTVDPPRGSEGDGEIRVTVTALVDRGVRPDDTRIAVSVTGSGDPLAVDFAPVPDFDIVIPANSPDGTATFTVVPEDDRVVEQDETLTVSGTSDLPVTPATIMLLDDDEASGGIVLSAEPGQVSEGDGPVAVTVTAALDRGLRQQATMVTVSVSGSGDPGAVDFAPVADFGITIEANAASGTGTFTLTPEDDAEDEGDETLSLTGTSNLPVTPAELNLYDDDEPPQQVFRVLLFESATNPARQGFLRVINHSRESGQVRIDAVDDGGVRREPVTLAIDGGEARHFNSEDLENGNAEKGLSGGVGPSTRGEWHLKLSSDLDIEVLAYARTKADGFVTTMHDSVPLDEGTHRLSFFNPGKNEDQKSLLRVVNTGTQDAEATITGTDDAGVASGEVRVAIPTGTVRTLSAAELESGVAEGIVAGALGTGTGKWRLSLYSPLPLAVKGLLTSPPGYLANLSTSPRTPGSVADTHGVLLFPPMSEPGQEGVVRVVNHGVQAAQVRILAMDDTAFEYEPLTWTVAAGSAAHFNSADLELGNADKELSGSTGAGSGTWRLDLTSAQDIEVLSYVRTADGFLTPVHDLAPVVDGAYRVAFFNPASNEAQVSRLRLINAGPTDASLTVTGVDDAGESPGSPVRLAVAAGTALEVSSATMESGEGRGIESGALGDGQGKWRLRIESDTPIGVMSLLDSPTGHVTNVSTVLESADRDSRP